MKRAIDRVINADVVVIGSGVAGLSAALELAPRKVTLLTKTQDLPGGSSRWAQGGVAAAMDSEDSPEQHAKDTINAGAGLNVAEMVHILTQEGPASLYKLIEYGMPFDTDSEGNLDAQKEAAHGRRRVLRAHGDATGMAMVQTLVKAVRSQSHITVKTDTFVKELVVTQGKTRGVIVLENDTWSFYKASAVVLACGGIGQVYSHTTNPSESTADGLALALRAGAVCADLEMVQFHPTALAAGKKTTGNLGLLTEALRGEGATLVNRYGHRFMQDIHPDGELAPRDVVARGVWSENLAQGPVRLNATRCVGAAFPERFPTVYALCREVGLDPINEPIPVAPAVHYHMGGVLTDVDGLTSLSGLWACGEVAATGVHGANRLASNSLLECLVFAHRVAEAIKKTSTRVMASIIPTLSLPQTMGTEDVVQCRERLQKLMYQHAGLVRNEVDLRTALEQIASLEPGFGKIRDLCEFANIKDAASGILTAALQRQESRGAHYREDHPLTLTAFADRQLTTLDEIYKITGAPLPVGQSA